MENQVTRGKDWLDKVLALMGIPTNAITEGFETISEDLDSCWLNIEVTNLSPKQSQLLIGEKGANIDALQYLANTLLNINQEQDAQGSYTIELDGYRVKRHQE